ncbi:MAG: TIGR02597 family protein [Verrucomicrobia bacterium]|nr:TIGR02597 family protein [Verrucomicrobiota bacterium]
MKKLLPILLGATAVFSGNAIAQNATTTPVGAMTYTFNATVGLVNTYMSVPLTDTPVFSGPVQSVGNATLTFSGTPFVANALAQAGSPYFLRLQSGAQIGRTMLVTANTGNSTTVDITNNTSQSTSLTSGNFTVAAGDMVQIFAGDTLGSFFGTTANATTGYLNGIALMGNATLARADTVSIYNRVTARQDAYFFSTTLGYWRTGSSTVNANGVILYPDASLGITRRAGRPTISFTVLGDVPAVAPKIKTAGNNQPVYGANPFPVDMTLGTLNLVNWTRNDLLARADTINIFNPLLAKMDTYYQKADGSWRKSGDTITDQSSFSLPAGSAVGFLKRGAVSGSGSFLGAALPYTP